MTEATCCLSIFYVLLVLHRNPLHIISIATSQLTTLFLSFSLFFPSVFLLSISLNNPECRNWPGTKHTPFYGTHSFSLSSWWWFILNSFLFLPLSSFYYWSWTHWVVYKCGGIDFIDDWLLIMLVMFCKVYCWAVFCAFCLDYLCIFLKKCIYCYIHGS